MNARIIAELEQLRDIYKNTREKFKEMAYIKAINAIRNYPLDITNIDEIKHLGIGDRIMSKIQEYIDTGKMQALEKIKQQHDPKRIKALKDFQEIYGIGPAFATKIFDEHNIHTIGQLKKHTNILTAAQKIGLKYIKEFDMRIPYKFIKIFQFVVAYCLNSVFGETFKIQIAGSFRRKKPDSGDIDIMLETEAFTLKQATDVLRKYNVIVDTLAEEKKKFMGVGQCPGSSLHPYRFRLDIFKVQKENWWTALVAHTGSKAFNTEMRKQAISLSYRLSDQGLYKNDKKIKVTDEKHLFKLLKMKWVEPRDR